MKLPYSYYRNVCLFSKTGADLTGLYHLRHTYSLDP